MGFSTSGAVAVMLIAFLLAASVLVPTLFNVSADTGEAFSTKADQIREQQNTDLTITTAEYQFETDEDGEKIDGTESLVLNVTNAGSQTLEISSTDLLINGAYSSLPISDADIRVHVPGEDDPRDETTIWPPDTALEIEFDDTTLDDEFDTGVAEAERAKIVTERGVSASSTVTDAEQNGES